MFSVGARKSLVSKRCNVVPDPRLHYPEPIVAPRMFETWVFHSVVQNCLPYRLLVNVCVNIY
jgi:hypothetical protein